MTEQTDTPQPNGKGESYPARWYPPQPEEMTGPTYWPLVLSVGITLLAWGAVTSLLISLLGLAMCVVAILNWIGDIRREQRHEATEK